MDWTLLSAQQQLAKYNKIGSVHQFSARLGPRIQFIGAFRILTMKAHSVDYIYT